MVPAGTCLTRIQLPPIRGLLKLQSDKVGAAVGAGVGFEEGFRDGPVMTQKSWKGGFRSMNELEYGEIENKHGDI